MRALVLVLAASACVQTATTSCPSSTRLCPSGSVCLELSVDESLCVRPDQFPPCVGIEDGMGCDGDGDTVLDGTCFGGACLPAECGNDRIDADEICDDGNNRLGDGCSADCRSTETCGNGIVDPVILVNGALVGNEQCDDGNLIGHDGCSSRCVTENPLWTQLVTDDPTPRAYPAMAYDAARGRTVMFGGGFQLVMTDGFTAFAETWQWNGSWSRVPVGLAPQARHGHAMAYDPKHQQVVLFGGETTNKTRDTWILDGERWSERDTTPKPPARTEHAMAYHPALGVVVFGGLGQAGTSLGDTWAWNGSGWTALALMPKPSARSGAVMAYDPSRGVLVLQGGDPVSAANETWELDGTKWTRVSTTGPAVGNAMLGFDPILRQMVLFGGRDMAAVPNDKTWAWNGQSWTQLATAAAPLVRYGGALANDHETGQLLLFGGAADPPLGCLSCGLTTFGDTWTWDGTRWTELTVAPPTSPEPTNSDVAALDVRRGRVVVQGGINASNTTRTWEHDGLRWIRGPDGPPARFEAAMAFDGARGTIVMFGGLLNSARADEMWTYDGITWTQSTVSPRPSPRLGAAMAYDVARARLVLFSGNTNGADRDTWEWDGTSWTDVTPVLGASSPPAREGAAMAWDPHTQCIVLFGGVGRSSLQPLDDTWTWDGTTWTKLTPPLAPSPRSGAQMAWDGARRALVLFGGGPPASNDTWAWDGTTWSFVNVPSPPAARTDHVVVSSPSGDGVLVFGGRNNLSELGDLWHLRLDSEDAYQTCSTAIDDDGDQLVGCADVDCWTRCTPWCPPGQSCAATLPHCGDGVCNAALETCRTCAMDCACTARCGDWACDPGETPAACPGDCP